MGEKQAKLKALHSEQAGKLENLINSQLSLRLTTEVALGQMLAWHWVAQHTKVINF